MVVVVFCGGKGLRLAEYPQPIPKGLIPVDEKPIVMHIMQHFASYNHKHFILLVGYMADKFRSYSSQFKEQGWTVEFVDSGENATKSQRLMDARPLINNKEFFLAYGDDIGNVNLDNVVAQNKKSHAVITLTAVQPENPYGTMEILDNGFITRFEEKMNIKEWVNGGYMIARSAIFNYLGLGDLEADVFPVLAEKNLIDAYKHNGFWMSVNTPKELEMIRRAFSNMQIPLGFNREVK